MNQDTAGHAKNSSYKIDGDDYSPASKGMKSEFADAIKIQ